MNMNLVIVGVVLLIMMITGIVAYFLLFSDEEEPEEEESTQDQYNDMYGYSSSSDSDSDSDSDEEDTPPASSSAAASSAAAAAGPTYHKMEEKKRTQIWDMYDSGDKKFLNRRGDRLTKDTAKTWYPQQVGGDAPYWGLICQSDRSDNDCWQMRSDDNKIGTNVRLRGKKPDDSQFALERDPTTGKFKIKSKSANAFLCNEAGTIKKCGAGVGATIFDIKHW